MATDEEYIKELMGSVSTGLPDDFTGTIANARFTSQPDYKDGALFFCADITDIDDPDVGDDGKIEDQRFGIGGTSESSKYRWITEDKGASVVRDDGKKASFNNSTALGRLLGGLLNQESFRSAVTKRAQSGDRFTPNQAAFYNGIRGHWHRVEEKFTGQDGQERTMSYLVMDEFAEFAGTGSSKAGAAKAATAKKAAKKAAPAKPAKPAPAPVEDAETAEATALPITNPALEAAYAIAREVCDPDLAGDDYGEYDVFQRRCYDEIDGLDELPDVMAAVDSYEDGSVWADVLAEMD